MQKVFLSLSLFSIISIPSVTGAAENHMRPGLWEVTTSSMLLALVPRIPPDQMQQLTEIARQYGLDLPRIQDGKQLQDGPRLQAFRVKRQRKSRGHVYNA